VKTNKCGRETSPRCSGKEVAVKGWKDEMIGSLDEDV